MKSIRREILVLALAGGLAAACILLAAESTSTADSAADDAASGDWPCFLGPDRNATASGEVKLARTWPDKGPEVLWSFDLNPGYGGAAVRDGEVFILDREPTKRDILYSIDLKSGQKNWSYAYDAPGRLSHRGIRSTPAVDANRVFTVGPFGQVHCISRKTHEPVWSMHLLKDFDGEYPRWGVAQSPLLYKDWVILAPQGPKVGLIACERASGKIVWKSKPFGKMSHSSPVLATLGGVEQVLQVSKTRVAGVDVETGRLLWTFSDFSARNPIPTPVAIGDGRVLLVGGYGLGTVMFRVSRDDDGSWQVRKLFVHDKCNSQMANPILHKGHIYALGNDKKHEPGLVCMDLDGKVLWQTGDNPNFGWGNLLLADSKLYVIEGDKGTVHLVEPDPKSYRELARAKLLEPRRVWAPPAISGGLLLLRDQTQLRCVDVRAKAR